MSTNRQRELRAMTSLSPGAYKLAAEPVDFRKLKRPGTYLNMHEKAAMDLAREYERQIDPDYSCISWDSQKRAQDFYNENGLSDTLDEMFRLKAIS